MFGRGHGHHHGFGGRRLKRLFAHGDLRFVILHLVAEKPRHGYEIIKAIETMVGGAYSPSPGTIYPALTLLEEQGYVAVQTTDGPKKLYAITDEGQAYLELNSGAVTGVLARMEKAGADSKRDVPLAIVDAIETLKQAVRQAGSDGDMSDERLAAIVAAIHEATAKIEAVSPITAP